MRRAHHRPSRPATLVLVPLTLVSLSLVAGCVTERSGPSRGVPFTSRPATAPAEIPPAAATLPSGPLTRPATPTATVSTSVRSAFLDLGTVPFNGLVLPLVSPDGRFIAVQEGAAPSWPTVLAGPGAEVPHGSRIRGYALPDPAATAATPPTPAPPDGTRQKPPAATQLGWAAPDPPVLLGRSCDSTGFLIEAPQPDGSRWIGAIRWVSGELDWLVRDGNVNAYATYGPAGELAYCRRAIDSNDIELVVRPHATDPTELVAATAAAGGYMFPMFTDEPGVVYAFSLVASMLELHALRLPERGEPAALTVSARQAILREANATTAYQMASSVQTPLPSGLTTARAESGNTQLPERFDKLAFFHPTQGRMCVYDRRAATMVRLFPGSIGTAPFLPQSGSPNGEMGYLVTTPRALEYVAISQKSEFDRIRGVPVSSEEGVSVLTGAYLPRLTNQPDWRFVLMGPGPGGADAKIHLFRLKLGDGEGSAR